MAPLRRGVQQDAVDFLSTFMLDMVRCQAWTVLKTRRETRCMGQQCGLRRGLVLMDRNVAQF